MKVTKFSQKCQNCIHFLESTYPEMQRKHIAKRLTIDITHQPDTVLVDV